MKIIRDTSQRELYSHDIGDVPPLMTQALFTTLPDLVVQPKDSGDIATVLACAQRHGVPVIPRGAASWGFGGIIPVRGGVVLDLSPFRQVLSFDLAARTVTVEAGARWSDIDIMAKKRGLCLMTYPSSKFSTVGGWIATGGYGINSLRYGHLAEQIASLVVVTPAEGIRTLTPEDSDFRRFIGTEGEFGVIVEATLRLRNMPGASFPHLLYFRDDTEAFDSIARFQSEAAERNVVPNVIRFLDSSHLRDTNEILHSEVFKAAPAVLLEFGDQDADRALKDFLAREPRVDEAPGYAASYLWNERLFGMKTKRLGPTILASEVIIPSARAVSFITRAKRLGASCGVDVCIDSYILDRERVLVMTTFLCDSRRLKYYVNLPLVSMLTSVAVSLGAEPYGLGIWNTPFIHSRYGSPEIAAMKAFKKRVDPRGVMNPGKFFRVASKAGGIPGLAFRPGVFGPAMKLMAFGAPVMGRLFTLLLGKDERLDELDAEASTHACAKCGNCIAVCPAYLITGDEAVTAKGKLALAKKLIQGKAVTREEAEQAFLCMKCRACEEICQTNLEQMNLWTALENRLEKDFGLPTERIRDFLRAIDASPEYWEMVERNSLNP